MADQMTPEMRGAFEKWALDNDLVGHLIYLEFRDGNYVAEALARRFPEWQAAYEAGRRDAQKCDHRYTNHMGDHKVCISCGETIPEKGASKP